MDIIRIAICDDEANIRSYLITLIRKQNIPCEIKEYDSADALLAEEPYYDLLFLDIELGDGSNGNPMNGMLLARRIRDRNPHPQPLIIFVSGHEKYVYDAFDVDAFQYLVKPVAEKKFAEVFHRAVTQISARAGQGSKKLVVPYGGISKVIDPENIYYAESRSHKVILHLKEENLEYYGKLGELEGKLTGQFFRIHKGYIVNLAYVEEYSRLAVTVENGDKLLISKYKYADFVRTHLLYLQRLLGESN